MAERTDSGAAGTDRKRHYSGLFRRFVLLTLVCSLLPLLMVGWVINIHYTRFARERMTRAFQEAVEHHKKLIALFLEERSTKLQLLAQTHTLDYMGKVENLAHIFETMNQDYPSIADLGVIDDRGRHLAYIGPYDLMEKNYSEAHWYHDVMEKGIYISDMFMGFRKVPHFIVAVARREEGKTWILRATIDTDMFRSLVENVRIGKTGEVYLIDRRGIYQTTPRFGGKIMEPSGFPVEPYDEGIKVRVMGAEAQDRGRAAAGDQIVATAWLRHPRWMLVVKQNHAEAFDAVNHANTATLLFLHLSALTILIVSILGAGYMIKVIKRRDREADQLNRQLMQAGKLASIGELSAGVAHEINNPLAIILTERQILEDMEGEQEGLNPEFRKQLRESLSQVHSQIDRCKRITQNLLRFARRTRSVVEPVDINDFLGEVVELMEREAGSSGIRFLCDLQPNLPTILSDPSQLQQVFLNLITNAIDAHEEKPYGSIHIRTSYREERRQVEVSVSDTGTGIREEDLEKIFDPFFTTKAVGRGTGLGLSICYSIMKLLGGEISVESTAGKGSEFTLAIPLAAPGTAEERGSGNPERNGAGYPAPPICSERSMDA